MSEKIEGLRKQYINQFQGVSTRLQQLKNEEDQLSRQLEQLRGALIALEAVSPQPQPAQAPAPAAAPAAPAAPIAAAADAPAAASTTDDSKPAAPAASS